MFLEDKWWTSPLSLRQVAPSPLMEAPLLLQQVVPPSGVLPLAVLWSRRLTSENQETLLILLFCLRQVSSAIT